VEARELEAATLSSQITDLKKTLRNLRPESETDSFSDRSTTELKTHREWLHGQIGRIRKILDERSSTLEEQSLCCKLPGCCGMIQMMCFCVTT